MLKSEILKRVISDRQPYIDKAETIYEAWARHVDFGKCRSVLVPTTDFIPVIDGLLKIIEELSRPHTTIKVVVLSCPSCGVERPWDVCLIPNKEGAFPSCADCGHAMEIL